MKKTMVLILIIASIWGWFLYPGLSGADVELLKGEITRLLVDEERNLRQNVSLGDLPSHYAQTSWPAIHRDSRNSNYLPFTTTSKLKPEWCALEGEYSAVVTPVVTGPEGNIYFTTGKDVSYGNLHAFNYEGDELWRSCLLDIGALCSSPLIDREGDLYLVDSDELFGFHSDGSLKWKCSGIDGPFASTVFSMDGYIIGINRKGMIYVFDPLNGQLVVPPLELPDQPPGDRYKISAPPGLWQGMVSSGEEGISISEIFNSIMGYQFKVTNTPVVDPANGRIYIIGNVKPADRSNTVQGRLYGIDFIAENGNTPAMLRLAFQTRITSGSGASPVISPDGSHIYVLDGAGILHAFNQNGENAWKLRIGVMPGSPTIGPDGTIYCVSGSSLCAVRDSRFSGSKAWEMDFTSIITKRLPDPPPSWVEENSYRREVKPRIRCNSVVSISKNYLYLTLSSGYELMPERNNQANNTSISGDGFMEIERLLNFFPLESLLVVVAPPRTAENSKLKPMISSIIGLPDTSEGIISLDKNGTVFCSHASIVSSIAYYNAQKMGFDFQKPTGGVSVLSPEE